MRRLQVEIDLGMRGQRPLALILGGISHARTVNDTHVHAVGDRVFVEIADALRSTTLPIDIVTRDGKQGFIVIAPGTRSFDAAVSAEQLR